MAIYDIVEIKKLALTELKKKHPAWKFESKTKKYSGGQSIDLTWTQGNVKMFLDGVEPQNLNIMRSPIYPSDNIKSVYTPEAISAFQEIFAEFNKYNWDRSDPMTDYFDVNFYMYFNVKKDYKYILIKKTTSSKTESSATQPKTNFNRGELVKECSGWKVYKKTLLNGRIVYNAVKDKEIAPNKGDWNTIKSEVYIKTGFKWGRFGAFEKWGEITESRGEQGVLNALCDILNKYYKSEKTTTQTTTQQTPEKTSQKQNFVYGKNWAIPQDSGKILVETLKTFAFEIFEQKEKYFSVFQIGKDLTIEISDNGGEFNINNAITKDFITSLGYISNNIPIAPFKLAKEIEDIYLSKIKKEPFKVNDSYKLLPANPKLEYCKIINAEGFIDYSESFPVTFQSFTALTKYIADNIGEIPTQGYDKHRVEWKWKFENNTVTDRWDVSELEANPVKYPNLYAGEMMRGLCYSAWAKLDTGGEKDADLKEKDEFYGTLVGKEGFELSTDQFNTILTDYLTYYKKDNDKRFLYITPEDRLKRFKDVYPRIIAAFEEKVDDKEEIIATIEALQYLANAGDDEAKTTIEALQYLI